jgi:AraC-like DNA-binding protein
VPDRARQRRVAHDRLVLIGLAPDEVSLARIAAAGAYEIVVSSEARPVALTDDPRHDVVCITSLVWWQSARERLAAHGGLPRCRFVLLMPNTLAPASQRPLGLERANALPVFTHGPAADILLARAIHAVRHYTVADALRARLAYASREQDLPTRALDAALQLLPHERTVPQLARALHRSERTLRRHLQEVHPDLVPQTVLSWAQLLHSAWYLSATEHPFDRVAHRVGASDAANLRRTLRALTGLTSRALMASGRHPVDLVLASWRERMAAPPPRRPAAPRSNARRAALARAPQRHR